MKNLEQQLIEVNGELVKKIGELQALIQLARTGPDEASCPLCLIDEACGYHKSIKVLAADAVVKHVLTLEKKLKENEVSLNDAAGVAQKLQDDLSAISASHDEFISRLPFLIRDAKLEAVSDLAEFQKKDAEHNDFIHRIAKRLGIHPDTSITRIQSMIEDAVRKLK